MKQMSRRERLLAAVRREPVDRVPYAVWRHFPTVDRSPAGLAQATLRFHERYGSDFLKLTPAAGWAVSGWGCVESEVVGPAGNRACASCAVRRAEDWARVRPLDPAAPGYAEHLETIVRLGFDRRIGDAPVLVTLFSPLSLARKVSGDRLPTDLRERPALVTGALEAIAETVERFAELVLTEGVAGVFYAVQVASRHVLDDEAYARFGEPYDRRVLEGIRSRGGLAVVHAHGDDLAFARVASLPADAWSWEDRTTAPSLREGQARVAGAVVGGLDQWRTLRDGTPDEAVAAVEDAIAQTAGRGLVVAPGCVLAADTPDATLRKGPPRPLRGAQSSRQRNAARAIRRSTVAT
jgi:uroporphyrinogen decarboxylase